MATRKRGLAAKTHGSAALWEAFSCADDLGTYGRRLTRAFSALAGSKELCAALASSQVRQKRAELVQIKPQADRYVHRDCLCLPYVT